MCTMSMVGDFWSEKWREPLNPMQKVTNNTITTGVNLFPTFITKEEFDSLKKEVEYMKELLIKAKIYDEKNGEPHCEMEDKVELLKKVAKIFNIDLSEVFGKDEVK